MSPNNRFEYYDTVIIGAGIYGLYSALILAKKKRRVLIIEYEDKPFKRGSFINQARIHYGYHYPRSYSTAIKSANFFERFVKDFEFAINNKFNKIYGISQSFSMTNSSQFKKFCKNVKLKCNPILSDKYFNSNYVEEAFETEEYAFDAIKIRNYFISELAKYPNVIQKYNQKVVNIKVNNDNYYLKTSKDVNVSTPFVLNSTYASTNQILDSFGFQSFKVKYELCEIIICKTSDNIKQVGLTLMDGPFFSLMPFGLIGKHSLTSVAFTPHKTSLKEFPTFSCQNINRKCTPKNLENCNECPAKPKTAWPYMSQLAHKYLTNDIKFTYEKSLFTIKPILKVAEVDDSRPTIVKTFSNKPRFVSVFSGKINTIYDLDEILL